MTDTSKQIIEKNTVDIHGKSYLTVAGRVGLWHEDHEQDIYVETKTRIEGGYVICEAVVKTKKGTFTGTSAVNLTNAAKIEKENPFEVAETSAVGRALGFANYGLDESIASADEIAKATRPSANGQTPTGDILARAAAKRHEPITNDKQYDCGICGEPAEYRVGTSKAGNPYRGVFCSADRTHVTWLKNGDPEPTPRVVAEARANAPTEPESDHVDPDEIPF